MRMRHSQRHIRSMQRQRPCQRPWPARGALDSGVCRACLDTYTLSCCNIIILSTAVLHIITIAVCTLCRHTLTHINYHNGTVLRSTQLTRRSLVWGSRHTHSRAISVSPDPTKRAARAMHALRRRIERTRVAPRRTQLYLIII